MEEIEIHAIVKNAICFVTVKHIPSGVTTTAVDPLMYKAKEEAIERITYLVGLWGEK